MQFVFVNNTYKKVWQPPGQQLVSVYFGCFLKYVTKIKIFCRQLTSLKVFNLPSQGPGKDLQ